MNLSQLKYGSINLIFLQICGSQQLGNKVILCKEEYYCDTLHTLSVDIRERLLFIVFNLCIRKKLDISSLSFVALVYSCHTTICTNFANGTRVSLIVYSMAFYFRDNVTFYATDKESQRLYDVIMKFSYKILLERKVSKYLAHDYCEILFMNFLESKDTAEILVKKCQQNGAELSDDSLSTLNRLIELVQYFNYFVSSTILESNNEEILKILYKIFDDDFINYIQQMYSILAYNLDDSPNLIANKYLEMKMQSSLSVKRIIKSTQQNLNKITTMITNSNAITKSDNDLTSESSSDNANDLNEKLDDNCTALDADNDDDCSLLNSNDHGNISNNIFEEKIFSSKSINLNSTGEFQTNEAITFHHPVMNKIIFGTQFNRDINNDNEGNSNNVKLIIENLPLHHIHYNIADNFKFICFRLNIKEATLQHLIDNFIIFGFRLLCDYGYQNILDVIVYVYQETITIFCTSIKRYINKYADVVNSRFRILLARSSIQQWGTELLSEIKMPTFIKEIREAKKNQFYLVEMFMNSCHDGYKVILKSKRQHDFIDIYVIIEKQAFCNLCCSNSFSFKIHMKISYNQQCFLYVHIYVHKINSLKIYRNLQKSSMIKKRITSENCTNVLDVLWNCRPQVQLIYTSDYNTILNRTTAQFMRNILFNVYIIRSGKYSPYPRNLTDANTMCFLLLRIAKSIAYKQEGLFHVKNDIDGPLNNIVSIKGITSIVDTKVDDQNYKCNCTTVCTMLNCPLYTGIQNPENCKLNL